MWTTFSLNPVPNHCAVLRKLKNHTLIISDNWIYFVLFRYSVVPQNLMCLWNYEPGPGYNVFFCSLDSFQYKIWHLLHQSSINILFLPFVPFLCLYQLQVPFCYVCESLNSSTRKKKKIYIYIYIYIKLQKTVDLSYQNLCSVVIKPPQN